MKFWSLVIFITLFFMLLFLPSCATSDYERIKIYKYDYGRGFFVRGPAATDGLDGKQAHGYFCVSPEDLEKIGSGVASCFQDLQECQSQDKEGSFPLPEIFGQ